MEMIKWENEKMFSRWDINYYTNAKTGNNINLNNI